MNAITKTLIAVASAVALFAIPVTAGAERLFFLVGTRHVYSIGTFRDSHLAQRQQIEQDYADGVANDQVEYQKRVSGGADPQVEGGLLQDDLNKLAVERDTRLGAIFERRDDIRTRHPELQIEGDGPYQVMGIDVNHRGSELLFLSFIVFAPWPHYVVVDRPYGWQYGVVYDPFRFHSVYLGWHQTYISVGRPAFYGFVGHHGPVYAVIGGTRGHFVPMAHGNGGYHSAPIRGGSFGRSSSFGRPAAPAVRPGGYSHSGGSFGRSNPAHPGVAPRTGGGYSHSGGSFGRSNAPARGSSAHSSFGRSTSKSSKAHSSFGRSTSSSKSHGSFGSGRSSGSSKKKKGR